MQIYQSHVVFRSFCDLYSVEKRQEEERSLRSNNSSRASSFSEQSGLSGSIGKLNTLSRNDTKSSIETSSSRSSSEVEYYPAGLYTSRMAQREADSITLDDQVPSAASQDLSLRRF